MKSHTQRNVACLAGLLIGCLLSVYAQQPPTLQFNQKGKFKIVQFTDLHVRHQDARSDIAFERMNQVLDVEQPDLVVFTGDVIYSQPANENLSKVLHVVSDRKIPFAVTFGNHDQEQGMSNEELFKVISQNPYNVTIDEVPSLSGTGNCALPIQSFNGKANAAVLYCLDSHRDCALDVKGYDYIHPDQIAWYQQKSRAFTQANQYKPLPSLFFFHIPLPEYNEAVANENASLYGIRREKACSPVLNTGLFAAMKEQEDAMGVFVGHDHDNDYAVNWKGILLAYGRFTGGPTEYTHLPNGARVIELTEGSRTFRTWIRLANNEVQQLTTFPNDYSKEAPKKPTHVSCATFNMRYDNPADKKNNWKYRKANVCKLILDKELDIIGMQEVLHNQLADLQAGLPGFSTIGVGREDGKTTGEYAPLFYRNDRFEALDSNTFWLSQYPDSIGFIGWDGACTRIATWAKLKDKATGEIFMFVNTHFDHIGTEARKNGALLIIEKIKEIVGDKPAILTGDFNVSDTSEAYQTLTTNTFVLKDAHKIAQSATGVKHTFHDFGRLPMKEREKIDFVFVTPQIKVRTSDIPQEAKGTTGHLSDHNPQLVNITF